MTSTGGAVGCNALLDTSGAATAPPGFPGVTAWTAPVDHVLAAPGALDCLDADDLRKAASFRRPSDRQRCLAGRVLLRHAMSAAVRPRVIIPPEIWRLRQDSRGKPCIASGQGLPELSLSISHSAAMVAVACSEAGDVGIDIELVEESGPVEEYRHVLTPDEQRVIDVTPQPGKWPQVIMFWCIKEACLKALGCGLHIDPSRIGIEAGTVVLDGDTAAKEDLRHLRVRTHTSTYAGKPYALAIAHAWPWPAETSIRRPLPRVIRD